ncbi:carbonic anhydrase 7 [Trichuris trichiura]|uniref:Carbonic anhydrase n=1 Tax=Trichuris trichiura TaxID=36087 RepID=A0A077ZBW4_TRITR|nr:carbonic anhydrase 7 [Trichuris trichiura]
MFRHYAAIIYGPSSWVKYFPAAKGNRQSPIDICASQAQFDPSLGDGNFEFRYEAEDCVEVCNVGTTWQITTVPQCKSSIYDDRSKICLALTANYLPATYILMQIHCHWGTEPMNGSEHVIGGVGYAGEVHLVHRNINYSTVDEALKHPDGFAVLAVFLNETLDDNLSLEPLVQTIGKIKYKNETERIPQKFDVKCLIPDFHNDGTNSELYIAEKREFWTYEGSLTTPPCSECVIWTVFRSAIPISSRQIEVFRTLYANPMEDLERNPVQLLNNIRSVQPLNSRTVRASFRAGGLSVR